MADTVLAQVAASFAQKENLATEALAFILNRSPAARLVLQRQIAALLGDALPITRVATQTVVGVESRPDIVLHADDGRTLGYVEAKFWAALTDAQPAEYLARLEKAGGRALVFLAPERRLPTLRVEILERLKGRDAVEVSPESIMVGTVKLGLLSWSKLLAALREEVSEDRDVASDVHQLRGLVARFEVEGFVPLTRADLDDLDAPRRFMSLAHLASEIVDAGVSNGLLAVKRLKVTPLFHGPGRYAEFKSAGFWLGLNHAMWGARGRTPVWMKFARGDWGRAEKLREPLRGWLSADPPRAYATEGDGSIDIPLLLAVGVEKDRVVSDAVRQIGELDAVLQLAGLPPIRGEAPTEP